jgi:hypothetical protein
MKIVIGTLIEHIAYIGRELMTELSRVSFPVYDIKDEIPYNLLSNLLTIGISSATDGLVVSRGSPR